MTTLRVVMKFFAQILPHAFGGWVKPKVKTFRFYRVARRSERSLSLTLIEPKGSRWRVKTEGFIKPLALRV